jgi:hypothetical protein
MSLQSLYSGKCSQTLGTMKKKPAAKMVFFISLGVYRQIRMLVISSVYSNIVILNKLGLARQKKGHNGLCHTLFNYNIAVITFCTSESLVRLRE